MKILLSFLLCLSMAGMMYAQSVINTDRPTNTYATSVVQKGTVVIETGVLLSRTENGNGEKSTYNDFGQTYVRIGTGGNLEIQVASSFASSKPAPGSDAITGLTPVKLGAKMHVIDEKGVWPEISFIGNITLPWIGEKEFRPEFTAPDFRFIFLHTLGDRFALGYNLGVAWDGFVPNANYVYSLMLSAAVVGNLSAFAEVYGGFIEDFENGHSFDVGFAYLINSNFQVDASFGSDFTKPNSHYFNFGAAFRFGLAAKN